MQSTPAGALSGRRVLEIADETGAYCGKLLADMGADVIKIEAPGGDPARLLPPFHGGRPDPERSLSFLYLNTNKRSLVLDLGVPDGQSAFLRLVATADIVVETLRPGRLDELGLGYQRLRALRPGLVLTSITGFGQTGPHSGYRSCDLVAGAMGGALYVTGDPEDPPVRMAGAQNDWMASTCAAASSLIALQHADRTGQGQHVDISAQETTLAVAHISGVGKWLEDGIVPKRFGTSLSASVPSGAYPCRDGLVYLMVNRPAHWKALAEWIHEETGNEEVLDPLFEGPSSKRQEYRDLLDIFISDMTRLHDVDTIYHEGQRRRIAFTPLNSPAQVVADDHLVARAYFATKTHPRAGSLRYPGAPYQLSRTPWQLRTTAPGIGEHDDEILREFGRAQAPERAAPASPETRTPTARGALADLRVLEFTAGMAGPWIGRFMAWCGAEVIRVESVKVPGVVRLYIPPWKPELGVQPRLSPWLTDWDAGKLFVSLDLKHPDGVALAKRLAGRSDVVIENQRSGAIEKLGLGWEALSEIKPDLIFLASSGFGESGPHPSYVTWGPNIEAMSGMAALSGFPERTCAMTQYAYPDSLSALHGLFAILCALDHRARTGEGQKISLCQLETTVGMIGPEIMQQLAGDGAPEKLGNGSLSRAPHGCYPCLGDDRWCVIAAADEGEWSRLCDVMEHPDWRGDPRFDSLSARLANRAALDDAIAEWTRERTHYEVMERLQAAGVTAGAVQDTEDQYQLDRHLAERGYFEHVPHLAKGEVVAPGIPLGLTGTPGRTTRAGADIGEDNAHVFRDLLGLDEDEFDAHVASGAIETSS
jgi:crotonobetainyl-CoA:carnitine CoA-transferase CaiB-like acyl-CoA transferase